ncbi:MAG TPA: SDR family oxidoreductase [Gammaproteobacteria bacterium]|nr:SDR family oxidoreductase [Gammaproteobacteria bacterium]
MSNVLVTGANRGLGLEFARQYAADGWRVFACCRNPESAQELAVLAGRHHNLSVHRLDVADHEDIDALAGELQDQAVDVLVNNAGTYGNRSAQQLGNIDYEDWSRTLRVNTLGPVRMLEAFLPHLERGERRVAATLTSLMGSIADNTSGGSYIYRTSKAALNAAMKSAAVDLEARGIGILLLHPGWVKTDMGGSSALITPEESIRALRQRIDEFDLSRTGRFINYDGREYPW